VNQAATATTVTSSLNPSTFGQSVTFTATVSSAGGTPTGTVTFYDGATTLGTGTPGAAIGGLCISPNVAPRTKENITSDSIFI